MFSMKLNHTSLKLLLVIIFSNSLSLASDSQDEIQNRNTKTVKVIDYVREGAIAVKQKNYGSAYKYYNKALSFLDKAVSSEERGQEHGIDLSGKLTDKEIYGRKGTEHLHFYNDEWSLKKRAALIANYAAEMAYHLKDYEKTAYLYRQAGDFGQDMGIAQAWYLAAACNSFQAGQYDKTLEYVDLSEKMAQQCPVSDVGCGRGFEPLIKACANWIAILKKNEKMDRVDIFVRRWKRFNRGFLLEQEKQKAQETFVKLDTNTFEQQFPDVKPKRVKRTYKTKVLPPDESTPLLASTTSNTSL